MHSRVHTNAIWLFHDWFDGYPNERSAGSRPQIVRPNTRSEQWIEGWKFYEQTSVGLGDFFLDCIQADVLSLKLFAGVHEMSDGFHRMLVKRFPRRQRYDQPLRSN